MTRLEHLTRGAALRGVLPNEAVTVVDVRWHGDTAVTLTYTDVCGRADQVVLGGTLVVPVGLLLRMLGQAAPTDAGGSPEARRRVELAAMAAVMASERALGFEPRDVSGAKIGYDVESRIPGTGKLRFIEVKGRTAGAELVTATRNEILYALNKPDDFILALVEVDTTATVRYVRRSFTREPDFGVEA
jgi:hypothetical protein